MSNYAISSKRPNLWDEVMLLQEIGKIIKAYNTVFKEQRFEHLPENFRSGDIWYGPVYPDWVFEESDTSSVDNVLGICYDVFNKESASLSENIGNTKKWVRPRLMEERTINSSANDNKKIDTIYGKRYDVHIRFNCIARSNFESMVLARQFLRMMEIHAPYLETGTARFMFLRQRPTYFDKNTRYRGHSLEFYCQIEEHWHKAEGVIDQINIEVLDYHGAITKE